MVTVVITFFIEATPQKRSRWHCLFLLFNTTIEESDDNINRIREEDDNALPSSSSSQIQRRRQ
jgi:hypothetical protein